jgi:hypothetical protein
VESSQASTHNNERGRQDSEHSDGFGGAAEAALIMKEVNGLLGGLGISASTRTRGRMASNLVMKNMPLKGSSFQGTTI